MDKKVKIIGAFALVIIAILFFGGDKDPDLTPDGERALKALNDKHAFMIKYLDEKHEQCLKDSDKAFCNKRTDYAKGEVEKNFKIEREKLIELFKK